MEKVCKIYVDSNVIINYCTGVREDVEVLSYIFRKRRRESLFTSSLAIVQTISNLQTKKKSRKAFSKQETITKLNSIINKFMVLDLTMNDVINGFGSDSEDIEDGVHYSLSQKRKCDAILTNNVSDYLSFKEILRITPRSGLGSIKALIK